MNRCRHAFPPPSTSISAAQTAPAGSLHSSRPLLVGMLPPGLSQPRSRPPGAVGLGRLQARHCRLAPPPPFHVESQLQPDLFYFSGFFTGTHLSAHERRWRAVIDSGCGFSRATDPVTCCSSANRLAAILQSIVAPTFLVSPASLYVRVKCSCEMQFQHF